MISNPRLAVAAWILALAPLGGSAQILDAPIQIVGFTNVDYWATDSREVDDGFRQGELSVLLTAPLAQRLAFFAEISAHSHGGGGHGGGGALNFGVMRALLRYDFADFFKISAGRYHPTIGYWPSTFHHGVWLETTVSTPGLFDRHEGALPGHFLGVRAEGTVLPGTIALSYAASVGNGRALDLRLPGDEGDANRERALLLSLAVRPPALFGLRLGGSLYHDRVSPSPAWEWRERVLAAHVVWEKRHAEVLAEYVRMDHDLIGGSVSAVSEGYYTQVGYRLPGRLSAMKPYARLERFDVPEENLLLFPLDLNYRALIGGVRYDFSTYAALKGEYRSERRQFEGELQSFVMQVSLTFGSPMVDSGPSRSTDRDGGSDAGPSQSPASDAADHTEQER